MITRIHLHVARAAHRSARKNSLDQALAFWRSLEALPSVIHPGEPMGVAAGVRPAIVRAEREIAAILAAPLGVRLSERCWAVRS